MKEDTPLTLHYLYKMSHSFQGWNIYYLNRNFVKYLFDCLLEDIFVCGNGLGYC